MQYAQIMFDCLFSPTLLQLHEPFCQPFGNRQLVHCLLSVEEDERIHHGGVHPVPGEIPAWSSCGRIVAQETADFWEFAVRFAFAGNTSYFLIIWQLCNAFFASIGLFVLYKRSRSVAEQRRKALVARIVHRPW